MKSARVVAMEIPRILKEYGPILISGLAVVISVIAAWSAKRDKKTEMEWTLRSQIGEAVSRITASDAELQDIETALQNAGDVDRTPFRSKRGILNSQRYAVARHASYLMRQSAERGKPDLVGDEEYGIVARVLGDNGDPEAEEYWLKAIRAAEGYHKAMHQRLCQVPLFAGKYRWRTQTISASRVV